MTRGTIQFWIQPGKETIKVVSPCVFTKSGLCHRNLSLGELMNVYDVNISAQKGLLKIDEKRGSLSRAFIKQPPEKVLYVATLAMLKDMFSATRSDVVAEEEVKNISHLMEEDTKSKEKL